MALSWSGRRQLIYYGVALVIALLLLIAVWKTLLSGPQQCVSQCGGPCNILCPAEAQAPVVLWSRAFPTSPQTYTAAAYIQNNNPGSGARAVRYSFQLFDASNQLIVERDGVTDLPPVVDIPIIETGINVGNRAVARTLFSFTAAPVWERVDPASYTVPTITNPAHSGDYASLSATVVNNTPEDAGNLTVAAILYDAEGVARAASKSLISVPANGSQPVVFTWPAGIQTPQGPIVQAEITILPSF